MEEVIKNVVEKISSYNIFNNFFPGIVFCYIVKHTTRISLVNGGILENLFIYYFRSVYKELHTDRETGC